MIPLEIQHVDALLGWLRSYFAVCALVYLAVAGLGGWYATSHRDRWTWIIPAMGVVYVVTLPYHWAFTNDDSFIFFRYAENLANGHGLVYNSGIPSEGFTSPAWMYLLAFGATAEFSTLQLAKIAGATCGAITILMMILTARRLSDDTRVIFLTALFVTTCQILQAWIPSGMDTALFMAWLSTWTYVLVSRPRGVVFALLLIAAGVWIRPEAYFVSLIGLIWLLYSRRDDIRSGRCAAIAGTALLAMALPFVWRHLAFGEFFPTTFFAKSDRTIRSGMGFLFTAINGYGPAIWALALAGLWQARRSMTWAGLTTLAITGYVIWVGGDVLIQRFSLWWLPFLVVGLTYGFRLPALNRVIDSRAIFVLLACLLAAQELHRMYCVTRALSENDGYVYVSANGIHTAEADAPIGRYLGKNGRVTDTVVTDNIGAIGYYSGMVIMDVNGLVDPEIAELIHRDRKAEIVSLVAARRPQWIVGYEIMGTTRFQLPNAGELPSVLLEHYHRVGHWQSRTGYRRVLLKRMDS